MRAALILTCLAATTALGSTLAGLSLLVAPPVEVAGEKAMVFIPKVLVGVEEDHLFLAELGGKVYKEDGDTWPYLVDVETQVGLYFSFLRFGPLSLHAGPFIAPKLSFQSNSGAFVNLNFNVLVGLRMLQIYTELPSSFLSIYVDLHPQLGIVQGLAGGVRF